MESTAGTLASAGWESHKWLALASQSDSGHRSRKLVLVACQAHNNVTLRAADRACTNICFITANAAGSPLIGSKPVYSPVQEEYRCFLDLKFSSGGALLSKEIAVISHAKHRRAAAANSPYNNVSSARLASPCGLQELVLCQHAHDLLLLLLLDIH